MKSARQAGRRRRSIAFEALESRRVMAATLSVYPLDPNAQPSSLAIGPNDHVWMALGPGIGELDPATGAAYFYPGTTGSRSIISGPGGLLWFVDIGGTSYAIGSINPTTHAIEEYAVPYAHAAFNGTQALAAGPDGNLWFVDSANSAIGQFNPTTHAFAEFPLPNLSYVPRNITAGPDGNLWFTTYTAVGLINPTTHAFGIIPLAAPSPDLGTIATGPDGKIWVNNAFQGYYVGDVAPYPIPRIASIDPATYVLQEYDGGGTGGIAAGPDGGVWYARAGDENAIGEIDTTTHQTSVYPLPVDGGDYPLPMVGSPDGRVWTAMTGYLFAATPIPPTKAAITGQVVLDPAGSGSTSTPIPGQTVYLDLKNDGKLDPGDPTANTDVLGTYTFAGLAPGNYTVRVVTYPGTVFTAPASDSRAVTASAGQLATAGALGILPTGSVLPLAYGPAPFGAHNPDLQTAEVTGLYELIYGRAPDAAGLAAWVSALKNGMSVQTAADDLLNSPEYDTRLILSYYKNYLADPNPSAAAVNQWVGFMQAGMTAEEVASHFLSSDVFSDLFPSDAAFIQALYGDVLGYLPSSGEVGAWLNVLHSGTTRSQAVAAFLNSDVARSRLVTGLFGTILARPADAAGQSAYLLALEAGWTPAQAAAALFGTQEYALRANATVG